MFRKIILVIILISFYNCKKDTQLNSSKNKSEFKYAKNISITENDSSISILSNGSKVTFNKSELPLTDIMIETTAAIAYLNELGAISTIKGVTDANYIYNEKIQQEISAKKILTIGTNNELFVEVILKHKPQLIIASSNPSFAKFHQQLEQNGIKILYIDEYKETDPLGRLEYLKVFGKLLNQDQLANSKVEKTINNYDSIKQIIQTKGNGNVTTILNTMYGDIWYLPTKNTLQSKLIDDAKGNYVFKNETGETTMSLTFEEVYLKSKNANYWLNTSYNSLDQMKAAYPNYTWFDAFKAGNIYNPDKRSTPSGAQDYYEEGIVRPDIILNDLGKIFYPNLFPNYELYFYQKIK